MSASTLTQTVCRVRSSWQKDKAEEVPSAKKQVQSLKKSMLISALEISNSE